MIIAIVDDTADDRNTLQTMLGRYFTELGRDFKADVYSSAEEFFKSYGPGTYSLIFFDIYMGGMNGMEAALRVRRIDGDCRLIFFSTSRDYAVDSYKVQAAYYLMKPLNYSELQNALNRILSISEEREPELSVALKEGIQAGIPMKKILYVDCIRRTPMIHTMDSVMPAVTAFSAIADQLETDRRFLCCNRAIYVNMDWILGIEERELILKNGERLPIRIRGRAQVKKEYLRYMLQELRENDEKA